ncbi:MAG TPA: UDP-N-acetylglucosamine--N-acetylmuramyl-(pentapeptide) pyrophosphoryl-undecaprenol N-acetylglucosamine transferase [Tepidisphaeraceae bacterium]
MNLTLSEKTIILAGGGTGGHLYPGIAVAQALRKLMPDCTPLFLCTAREIDRVILEPTGFEFIAQPIVPPTKTVGGLLKFWKSWRETKDLFKRTRRERSPVAVLGLGGYAAGVAVRAAAEKRIPTAILNPDVVPGKANQFLVRKVRAICCQFAQSAEYLPANHRHKVKVTGCPIREDFRTALDRKAAATRLGLDPRMQTLTITGASQGALTVNDAVLAMVKELNLQGWQILHLAGRDHAANVRKAYREMEVEARVVDFTPGMADVWAVTDLTIARSGASTCAELTACGVPSILMPYPFHKDMHQRANAQVLVDAGAAVLVDDEKDAKKNAAKLTPAVQGLLRDMTKRTAMAEAARKLGRGNAAEAVAGILGEIVR